MTRATQGHRYHWRGLNVLAMESGTGAVRVRQIRPLPAGFDWLGAPMTAPAAELEPQPMGYFKGDTPK